MKKSQTFVIPIEKINPRQAQEAVEALKKQYSQPIEFSYDIRTDSLNENLQFTDNNGPYRHIRSGDIAEYDQVMGLWYVQGKENNPLNRGELQDTAIWQPCFTVTVLPEKKPSVFQRFLTSLTGNPNRPLNPDDKFWIFAVIISVGMWLTSLLLTIFG